MFFMRDGTKYDTKDASMSLFGVCSMIKIWVCRSNSRWFVIESRKETAGNKGSSLDERKMKKSKFFGMAIFWVVTLSIWKL